MAPDRLVGNVQAALGEEVLNIAIAQGKVKRLNPAAG
jgi:hypothetical protein